MRKSKGFGYERRLFQKSLGCPRKCEKKKSRNLLVNLDTHLPLSGNKQQE